MIKNYRYYELLLLFLLLTVTNNTLATTTTTDPQEGYVAHLPMQMMILPGTREYLKNSIAEAEKSGAKLIVISLDTPGGMLNTAQEMVQDLLGSPIPVIVYVAPKGGAAISAGVFITLAGHIAAMSPGTSIGAAHPVMGDGKDIEGDMRAKAENMTIAMVRSISETRGRNVEWAEKSVKESSSITENEALKLGVIDLIAEDLNDLLKKLKGRKVKIGTAEQELGDYSRLPIKEIPMGMRDRAINLLANPNIAALLWLGATTGITLELYNPGAIFPGVVGVICLVLALLVSSVIPISQGGIVLLVLGGMLLALEVYVGSGILGVGGLIALALGAVYLIDVQQAPDLAVSMELIIPVLALLGGLLLWAAREVSRSLGQKTKTGKDGMVGARGKATELIADHGKVYVNGEYWRAVKSSNQSGIIEKDAEIEVEGMGQGLELIIKKVKP